MHKEQKVAYKLAKSAGRWVTIYARKLDGTDRSFNCKITPASFDRIARGYWQILVKERGKGYRTVVLKNVFEIHDNHAVIKF